MRRTVRHAAAFAAAVVTAGLGLVAVGQPAAAAPAACPAGMYCLYDNPDYTGLLVVSATRWVPVIPAQYNDRISAVINNNSETLNLFKNVEMDGPNGSVRPGERYSYTGQYDNLISSYYLY